MVGALAVVPLSAVLYKLHTVLSAGLARATHRGTADAAAAPLALSSSRRSAPLRRRRDLRA